MGEYEQNSNRRFCGQNFICICYLSLTIPPANLVLFRFIALVVFTDAVHYALLSSLPLSLLPVSKIHIFSSVPRSSPRLETRRHPYNLPLIAGIQNARIAVCQCNRIQSKRKKERKKEKGFVVCAFAGLSDPRGALRR
jgi:hypothetical protein